MSGPFIWGILSRRDWWEIYGLLAFQFRDQLLKRRNPYIREPCQISQWHIPFQHFQEGMIHSELQM